jgi:hypothetical protein
MGEEFKIERIGTDGGLNGAMEMLKDLDGKVDAIGLGGIDLYLVAGSKRYVIRDAAKMAAVVKKTPVFDGSGLKNTLEREIIRFIAEDGKYINKDSKVFILNSVDRFGMAEAIWQQGCKICFSDFMTGLGLPIPIRSMGTMRALAAVLLPIFTKVPFEMLYPTGSKQNERTPRFRTWFNWADVWAGDFLVINRYMPDDLLPGKVIIANTVTKDNVEELRRLGLRALITTTPEFEGRSFGTNVMEAVYATLLGKKAGDRLLDSELIDLIKKLGVKPRIVPLND